MTPDEAREAFDAAFEGELTKERRAAFDAVLAADAALREEYDEFASTLRTLRGLGVQDAEARTSEEFVANVERTLRTRSRGRFFRDRYSMARREERVLPFILAVVVFLMVVIAVAGRRVVVVRVEGETSERR